MLEGEDEVAASVRDRFRRNISAILDDLRDSGIKQKDIAEALGKAPAALSKLRGGEWFPSAEEIDKLLEALNKFSAKELDLEDLFRNPARKSDAIGTLLEELAKRAGYDLKPRKT